MWLQICQLIIVIHATTNAVKLKTIGRDNNHSVHTYHHSTKDKEGVQNVLMTDLFVNKGTRERNPEKNRVPKLNLLPRDTDGAKRNMQGVFGTFNQRTNKKKSFTQRFSKKKANIPEEENTKIFWNYFVHKLNAAPEDYHHPVKTEDIQREVCKTLPFSQNITHENCDEVVIQNNLCFGKCNSLTVPNQRKELNICSHCRPFKFRMRHLRLNCKGSKSVLKAIMVVEECKCMIQKHSNHGLINVIGHQ